MKRVMVFFVIFSFIVHIFYAYPLYGTCNLDNKKKKYKINSLSIDTNKSIEHKILNKKLFSKQINNKIFMQKIKITKYLNNKLKIK